MVRDLTMVGVGLLLGLLSGIFGVGGSSIATPVLRLLNVDRLFALATPLPVSLPTALVGTVTYWRAGKVNLRAAGWTALGGYPAVIVGSYLTTDVPGRLLMALTGLFVILVSIRLLRPAPPGPTRAISANRSRWMYLLVGAVVGFLSGLLANGGGFLLVPAYLLIFDMEASEAAATSLVTVALFALPGTWVHWRLGHIDWRLALLLAAGVIPATHIGARIGVAMEAKRARKLFGYFLLLFGTFFLIRTLIRADLYGWFS